MWKADYISYKGNTNFNRAYQGAELVWEKIQTWTDEPFWVENINDYPITFYVREDCIIRDKTDTSTKGDVLFSFDKENWEGVNSIDYQGEVMIPPHTKMWLINDTDVDLESTNTVGRVYNLFNMYISGGNMDFEDYATFNMGGNFHSILYNWNEQVRNLKSDNACLGLFMRMKVVDASKLVLPSLIQTKGCYYSMFEDCQYLKNAPKILAATTLAERCYQRMFENCYSLQTAPELPALEVSRYAYRNMFENCSSLKIAPKISAKTIDIEGCYAMFYSCNSLTTVMELPFSEISNDGCHQMFEYCISLQQVPPMEIKKNAQAAFRRMFANCSSLKQIKMKFNGNLSGNAAIDMFTNCTSLTDVDITGIENIFYNGCVRMFKNCTSLKYPPEINIKQVDTYCCQEMFKGCTSLLRSPILSALTGKTSCYLNMFEDCVNLKEITCLLLDANLFTYNWVKYIPEGGTFYKHPDAVWEFGTSGIPNGWIVENYTE